MSDLVRLRARHAKLPKRAWDGVQMIYSDALNQYFQNIDDAKEAADVRDIDLDDLLLVLCEPVHPHRLSAEDFDDELPEDGEIPDDLREAIREFNASVRDIVLSWEPGRYALDTRLTEVGR